MERSASFAVRARVRIVQLVRAVPIRWRILSIALLNSAVVAVLAFLIWNGAKVLGSAWDDVRQVRESDKILALLESETGRLQNLIHRYINQPSPELFAEILLLREAVLGTLTTRASTDPMLSGSVKELERRSEEHTSELQSQSNLVCRLLLEKKKHEHQPVAQRRGGILAADSRGQLDESRPILGRHMSRDVGSAALVFE